MKTQTGSISFEATGGFNSYAKQNYATLSQIKGQFATSSTGKTTVNKEATIVPSNADWSLFNGATVTVKFDSANSAMNPTLNINGSGAKPIRDYKGNELTAEAMNWKEGSAMAFTYDGTYWRLQDSDLIERMYSAETAIDQNANEIVLKASKEEAYQLAQPNLIPYFESQPINITTNTYWKFVTNLGTITEKEDGWVRFQYTNNTTTAKRAFETGISLCPSVVPGREYTWLVEYRHNASINDTNNAILDMYLVQATDNQFWGAGISKRLDNGSTSSRSDMAIGLTKNALNPISGCIRRTKIAENVGSSRWSTGATEATNECARWNCNVAAGATVDIEFRISLYEGEYTGPWKPYGGPQLYASQSELKITSDEISTKVSKDGVISSINQTAESVKISADKIELDGTAVFNSLSEKGYGSTYELLVPINSANGTLTATLYKNGIICTDSVYFEGQYTTNGTAWSNWAAMTGTVTVGTKTATHTISKPGQVQTIKIVVYNTASKEKVLATYTGTLVVDSSGAIASAEQNAKDYVDNQVIGGRNLWIQRDTIDGHVNSSTGTITSTTSLHKSMQKLIEVEPGETLIEQMWNPNLVNNTTNTNRFAYFKEDKTFLSVVNALRPNGDAYQMKKYVVPANAKYVRFGAVQGSTTGYDKDIKIKIEKGTMATDYTAAPEDIEAATWTWYAECNSAANDTAKIATLVPETENFFLEKGQRVGVAFSITNTAAVASLTLNVNNTGAKPIKYTVSGGDVGNLPAINYLKANRVYDFMYDGTNWVMQYNYNSDTVNRTRWQNVVKAAGAITWGKLICGTANGYQNIAAGVSFDLTYPVLYAATTKAAGETSDNNYLQINGINLANTAAIQNPEQYKTVFLKGKVIGNSFTIDSTNIFTCTIPTAADDYFYMPLGMFYNSTTNIYFNSSTALWAFIDGKFRAVTPTEIVATQKIYYRSKVSGTVPKPTTWITNTSNVFNDNVSKGNNGWSTKVTAIASGKGENAVKYLYLYTCEQRKRLDGTIDCTTVLLDDSTTIIDGGNIITHSITANQLDAANINASNMLTIGAFNADDQKEILNSELNIGGRNLLSGNAGKPGKWTVSAPATANFIKIESNNGYNVNISFNTGSGYENLNSPAITVEPNQQYTLSCDYTVNKAYTNVASNRNYGISIRTDSGNHASYDDLVSNSLGQAVFKTTVGAAHTSFTFTPTVSTIYLCLNGGNILDNQSGLSFDIRNIKLEKGNQDTDWSPAPEDMATADDVNNISIGGRNLFAYSKTKYGYYSGTNTTITNNANARHIDEKFPISPGESVTFQQWGGYADAGGLTHQIRWLREDGTPISAYNFGALKQTGHVVKTATAPEGTVAFEISCIEMLAVSTGDNSPNWGDIKVKLEYGNKPTDYSPAPEDLIQDGINLLRDTQNPSETAAISEDHWCSQSGGNAVRSFGEITDSPIKGLKYTFRYTNNTSGNADWAQNVTFLTDEDGMDGCYTYSCWARAINGNPRILVRLYGNDEKRTYSKVIGTAWERIIIPFFYVTTANTASNLRILMGMQSTGSLEIIAPKLERGIYATAWTASPKDVDAEIAAAQVAAEEAKEAAQAAQVVADGVANPNLSPFFSHDPQDIYNASTNPEGYWTAYYNSTTAGWTQLDDGWGHYVYNNTTTSNKYVHANPTSSPVFIAGRQYTVLAEIRNFSQNGTGKVYLRCPDPGSTGQLIRVNGQTSVMDTEITANKSEIRFQVLAREITSDINRLGLCIRTDTGSNAEFDMRISIYESLKVKGTWYAYTGPYKPYVPVKIITATQRIYYRSKVSGAPAAPTTWITQNGNKYNENATAGNAGWSKKITPVAASLDATKYIYLYTCEQQKYYDGTIKCTTVLLDDSQTVIDGGNIATGSVTANKLNATDINASHILTVGSFTTATENSISNDKIVIGGTNLLYNSADTTLWPLYSQGYNCAKIYMTENLIQGETYSLRVWGNVTRSDKTAKLLAYWGGGSNPLGTMTYNSSGWWELKFTVTAAQAGHANASSAILWLFIGPAPVGTSGTTYTSTITKAKLEKGNKHTDWTPAPEDIDSAITTVQNTANAAAPKTSAVSRTQRIYYQSASTTKPSTPGTASSNWVTDETGAADKWTLKRMSYSSTKPYIYTCEQKQVVSGTISYTPVLLDDTTTVIDGGKIITGSVTANQIAASAITAEKIKAGAIGTNQLAANAVTADKIQAGAIAIGDFNAETANLLNTAYSTANSAYSTANNAAKTATNYIYADSAGIRIASASPSSANQRLHLTSSTATFYDGGNNQRISINSSSGVIVGHPSRGRVQVVDAGINIFDNSNKKRVSVDSRGFHVYDTTGTTEVALMGANTARLGSTTNSAFYLNSNSLQAYYMSGTNRIKYFEVTPTGMSYGNNTVASQSYVTGQGYQTAAQVSTTANTIANTAANTYVTNRDKAQYGKCSTAANIAQKDVACDTFPDTLVVGMRITVDFTNANTEITPKLKVGTTTAKSIKFNGAVGSATDPIRWGAKARLTFQYDGTNWCLDEQPPTYSATGTLSNGVTTVNKNGALIVNGTTVAVRYSTANTYVSGALSLNLSTTGNATIYNDNKATSTTNILTWSANTILTFVREGSYWYLTDRSDAKTTASNYMYFDSTNGLRIAQSSPSSATTSYVQIKNDGIKIVSNNANAFMDISSSAIKIQRSSTSYALIDTSAIKLQTSNTNYVNISSSTIKLQINDQNYIVLSNNNGLTFYKSGKLVSSFGETTVLHNTENNAYVKLDYHSLQLIDKDNNSYLHASDLRDESGYANVIDNFKGDGSTKDFYVTATPYSSSELQVKVNNVVQTQNTQWVYYAGRPHITFNQAPSINAIITVSYRTIDSVVAFTFGKRGSGNIGIYSFCTGFNNVASGGGAYAEGANTIASGTYSHAEGQNTRANGSYSHAEGQNTIASGICSHAEGYNTIANGSYSHAEGRDTRANGFASHAEGDSTWANGSYSHAEGRNTRVNGYISHAEGYNTRVNGYISHAEGCNTVADGNYSHAEGDNAKASGICSHAEGYNTIANGSYSHAEGYNTIANGSYSHAEGRDTRANGSYSHAEGQNTRASGSYSHAGGYNTIASYTCQTAIGQYNRTCTAYFVVGAGSADNSRRNALEVYSSSAYFNGTTSASGTSITSDIRVKEKIKLLNQNDAIDFIKKLKPSSYIKNGDRKELGFIAQEIEALDKYGDYLVSKDSSGAYDLKDFRLLDYQGLIAPTVAALQAALEKIEILETKVKELESKLR